MSSHDGADLRVALTQPRVFEFKNVDCASAAPMMHTCCKITGDGCFPVPRFIVSEPTRVGEYRPCRGQGKLNCRRKGRRGQGNRFTALRPIAKREVPLCRFTCANRETRAGGHLNSSCPSSDSLIVGEILSASPGEFVEQNER